MNQPEKPMRSPDPLIGSLIAGNFRVERLIGTGAMGNVYKCEQLSLAKSVAVKVLHQHLMSDEKLVLRFKREAKSASMLNHPNSIQIIDSGQDTFGTLYIAMELLNGRDLAQVIREDFPLPLPRVLRIMAQVLSALEEAHVQGVIHRDLKPSNIMLIERRGEKDFVKVCDFGIAKAQGMDARDDDRSTMLTIQGLVCGTPEYMAPEQARAEPLDGRADLYSAAVILYQLVTGDIPFRADSPMGIVSRHLSEPPVPPSRQRPDLTIPTAIDTLILRGMEKHREQRFPSAVAFRQELELIGSWLGAGAPPTPIGRAGGATTAVVPSAELLRRFGSTASLGPTRKRRWPLALGALALVAAAAAAFLVARPEASSPPDELGTRSTLLTSPAIPTPSPAPAPAPPPQPLPLAAPAPSLPASASAAPSPSPSPSPSRSDEPAGAAEPAPTEAPVARAPEHDQRRRKPARPPAAAVVAAPAQNPPPAPTEAPAATDERALAARGPREVLAEGEKLLGQGEVKDACARGEEAKRMNPKLVSSYRFLGKCYMRAGDIGQANENYRKYLELSPNASDAMFIKSIVK
ncbi:MAG TPA: protein kinase [Polyangia bacterium]|nr:protein kinase [Polyangia bacterium]